MSSYLEDPSDSDDRDLVDEDDDRGVTDVFGDELDEMVGGGIPDNEDD